MLFEIRKRLAHGEMRRDLLFGVERAGFAEQPFQTRQTAIARLELPHVRQVEVNGRFVRRQLDGPLERRLRLLEAAQSLQRDTEIVVGSKPQGFERECAPVLRNRLFQAIKLEKRVAQI